MNTGGKKNCKYYDGTNNNLHLIRGRVVRCLKLGGYIWALGHTRVVCAIVCTNGNCKERVSSNSWITTYNVVVLMRCLNIAFY